ncbi:MAG: DUF378 domain-containing protein [Herminiimonas sp.]|nr:DUF378 domain-containing protein [Herminiimonas sp.]
MATMNPNMTERRTITDRRAHGSASSEARMKAAEWIPMLLLAVGGLNWGLIGLFNFNLVSFLFGEMTTLTRLVYVVVGLCALYSLYLSSRISSHK